MAKRTLNQFLKGWRSVGVLLLTALGIIALVGFMITHWVDRQLLTTDNWVNIVAPLPKDDAVATALSDYSVNKLFNGIDVQQQVTEALPDKASFLAEPLTDQLTIHAKQLTKNIIQSDQFQSVWVAANRTAQSHLVAKARGEEPTPTSASKKITDLSLNISSVKNSIQDRLGTASSSLFSRPDSSSSPDTNNDISINVSLKSSFDNFKRYVNSIDFLNGILWLVSIAALLGALAMSRLRRRQLIIISGIIMVITLLQLIGVKVLRPAILNQLQNISYKPAAGVVYDQLLDTFRSVSTSVFICSFAIFVIAFSIPMLKRNKWIATRLGEYKKSNIGHSVRDFRASIANYNLQILGVFSLLVLIFMAFVPNFDWQGVLRAILVVCIAAGLIGLLSLRSTNTKGRPMKQAR